MARKKDYSDVKKSRDRNQVDKGSDRARYYLESMWKNMLATPVFSLQLLIVWVPEKNLQTKLLICYEDHSPNKAGA